MAVVKDKQALKEQKDLARSRRLKELRDIRSVMGSEEGRRFIWRLLEECRVFLSTYDDQPVASYYKQGRRAVGLVVYNDILESCPELFWKAQGENINTEKNDG